MVDAWEMYRRELLLLQRARAPIRGDQKASNVSDDWCTGTHTFSSSSLSAHVSSAHIFYSRSSMAGMYVYTHRYSLSSTAKVDSHPAGIHLQDGISIIIVCPEIAAEPYACFTLAE